MKDFEIVENFKKQGYLRIHFPHDDLINKVLAGFTEFLKKPLADKKLWTSQIGEDVETGYLLRDKSVNKMTGYAYDHKDVLHFQPDLYARLNKRCVPLSR